MNAFNCPQCGASLEVGQIESATVRCPYCDSVVIVPAELRPQPTRFDGAARTQTPFLDSLPDQFVRVVVGLCCLVGVVVFLFFFFVVGNSSKKNRPSYFPPPNPRLLPTPKPTPAHEGYRVAFTFGSDGTGPGYFKDEMGVAVDGDGRIYVSDETRRVQRFDITGNFLNTWNVPTETKWYAKLKEGPSKIFTDSHGNLYAVLAGVIVKFDGETGETLGAAHGSDYIRDAAPLKDGGMLIVSQKGADDELVQLGGDGRAERRTHRFVSSQLDKKLEVEALRVAADPVGDTFALYAIGGVSGEHWYDDEDTSVFMFAPDGKYLARFGGGGHQPGQYGPPSAIAADNRGRIFVVEPFDKIHVFASDGRYLRTLIAPHGVNSMAFDWQNNFYIAGDHKVSKLVLDD